MYAVKDGYQIRNYAMRRTIRAKATIGGISLTDAAHIQTAAITRPALADTLIGGALSAQIELTALDPDGLLAGVTDGAALTVWLGPEDEAGGVEWIPFQTVTVDRIEYDPEAKLYTFAGFDDMARLDALTWGSLETAYPATLRELAAAAADAAGLTLSGDPFLLEGEVYTAENPPNLAGDETLRQVIGWIAEAALSNAVIGRDGAIRFIPVRPAETADAAIDAKDYFTLETGSLFGPVNTLVLGRLPQEDNLFREDAAAVELDGTKELRLNDNPFLDGRRQAVIDTLFDAADGLRIQTYTLDWRGDPALDPGDTLQITDSREAKVSILFGGCTLEFDGGLRGTAALEIPSGTETDKSKASSTGEKLRKTVLEVDKANQRISGVVQTVEETQDYVNGVVEQVRQENSASLQISKEEILNQVSQTYTRQSETEALAEQVASQLKQTADQVEIRFTQAQEATGQVAADLAAEKTQREAYIRFTEEGMELGKTDSALTARLANDRLSFFDSGQEVSYISNSKQYITQAEITDNLQIGSFGFVTRASGSLSIVWKG